MTPADLRAIIAAAIAGKRNMEDYEIKTALRNADALLAALSTGDRSSPAPAPCPYPKGITPPKKPFKNGFNMDEFLSDLTPEECSALGDMLDQMDAYRNRCNCQADEVHDDHLRSCPSCQPASKKSPTPEGPDGCDCEKCQPAPGGEPKDDSNNFRNMVIKLLGADPHTFNGDVPTLISDLRTQVAALTAERDELRAKLRASEDAVWETYEIGNRFRNRAEEAEAKNERLRERVADATELILRYRNETPLGNQPHMIAHLADAWLAAAQGEGDHA